METAPNPPSAYCQPCRLWWGTQGRQQVLGHVSCLCCHLFCPMLLRGEWGGEESAYFTDSCCELGSGSLKPDMFKTETCPSGPSFMNVFKTCLLSYLPFPYFGCCRLPAGPLKLAFWPLALGVPLYTLCLCQLEVRQSHPPLPSMGRDSAYQQLLTIGL